MTDVVVQNIWKAQIDSEAPLGKGKSTKASVTASLCVCLCLFHFSEHPLSQLVSDSDSEMDSTEQLALGSTDTLSNGHKADLEAAKRLAKRLYNLDGFKKADVARHLGKKYVWVLGEKILPPELC